MEAHGSRREPPRGRPRSHLQPSHLVLDGQQRLTSLYQALFGVGQSRFFLDLGALISGAEVNDGVRVLTAERAEGLSTLEAQANALMMPLSGVRNGDSIRWIDSVVRARSDDDPDRVRRFCTTSSRPTSSRLSATPSR